MTKKDILYHLLYQAFIDIRLYSHEGKGIQGIFKISDLMHNLPLKLSKAESDDDFDDIYDRLIERAEMKKCTSWIDNAISRKVD